MGADCLNEGRNFHVNLSIDGQQITKKIDVIARIDDVVIVAQCKSAEKKQNKSLQKEIGEFSTLKGPLAKSIKKHFNEPNLKFLWLIATRNIIWGKPDRLRAGENNIHVIEDRELRYFETVAKNVGKAAKYQFLGEFLASQQIPSLANCIVPAIRTKLAGQWAFFFLAPAARLLPIAFVNHRGLRDPDGAPAYQRVLKKSRLKEIGLYLDRGGFFPNCITANFKRPVRFDKQTSFDDRQITFGQLYLPDSFKSIWIIDGQHRLYGFTETAEKAKSHVLPVLAFEKLPAIKEAELFTTINSKQQKVAPGLLDELAGELKLSSESHHERCGAIIARSLDLLSAETGNPFEDRIKSADISESEAAPLTISEIKKGILAAKLLGVESKSGIITPGPFYRNSPEESVHALCEGLTEYFSIIEKANQARWELGRAGYLCSNIGVQGHIRLLASLCEHIRTSTGQEPHTLEPSDLVEQIKPLLAPVVSIIMEADDLDFSRRFKQPFGSGGPPRYYAELCKIVRSEFEAFNPPDLDRLLSERDEAEAVRGDSLTKQIIDRVHGHVIKILKQNYGVNEYFDKGVPFKEIKKEAYSKRIDDNSRMPAENYLDLVDLKKIIECTPNWDMFKETMNIKLPNEKKGQAKYVGWLLKLNEIRRVNAHPYGRKYEDSDIELLEFIYERLNDMEA
ncbi:DGQHR domain-containing protein [Ferrovibrio sp. MS7]|uniref:DGQHR domain-containing protein n=1 Tax=Ferrovibrio plantarum TaxID=3119164 RepID=UPI00313494A1